MASVTSFSLALRVLYMETTNADKACGGTVRTAVVHTGATWEACPFQSSQVVIFVNEAYTRERTATACLTADVPMVTASRYNSSNVPGTIPLFRREALRRATAWLRYFERSSRSSRWLNFGPVDERSTCRLSHCYI